MFKGRLTPMLWSVSSMVLLLAAGARAEVPRDREPGANAGSPEDAGTVSMVRREALYRTFQRAAKGRGDLRELGVGSSPIVGALLTGVTLFPVGIAAAIDGRRPAVGDAVLVGGGVALGAGLVALALGSESRHNDMIAEAGMQAGFASAWLGLALSGRNVREDGSTFGADRVHLGPLSFAIAGYATTGLLIAEGVARPRLSRAALRRDAHQLADAEAYLAMGDDDIAAIEGDLAVTATRWPGWVRAMPHLLAVGASIGVAIGESSGDERLLAVGSGLSSLLMAFLAAAQDEDLLTVYRDELGRGGLEVELVLSGAGLALSGRF